MNIIFGRPHAELLNSRYVVLEIVNLEDLSTDYQCFCIIEGNSLPVKELPMLDHYKKLHSKLLDNLKANNKTLCKELVPHLHGRWGGELDTFYQAILEHIK